MGILISSSAVAAVMSINNSHRRGVVSLHPLDVHDLDCSRCGDCCGRVRLAVPEDLWQVLQEFKRGLEALHGVRLSTCEVFKLLAPWLCQALGRVPRRPVTIKGYEEMLSRDLMFKPQYMLGRVAMAPDPGIAWRFLYLGLKSWFLGVHRMVNRQPITSDKAYVERFLGWLGVRNPYDWAWLLRNALRDERLVRVEHAQGYRYTQDIVSFKLNWVDSCPGWPWGSSVDAAGHVPVVLLILTRYLQCLGVRSFVDYLRISRAREPPPRGSSEE